MKRTKMLLTSVALCTVFGSALAFKAKGDQSVWVPAEDGPQNACTIEKPFRTLEPNGQQFEHITAAASPTTGSLCTPQDVYLGE